jgi:hypothetical protein
MAAHASQFLNLDGSGDSDYSAPEVMMIEAGSKFGCCFFRYGPQSAKTELSSNFND